MAPDKVNVESGDKMLRGHKWSFKCGSSKGVEMWLRWLDDKGKTWNGLAVGLEGESAEIPVEDLAARQARIQVLAHDGFSTAAAERQDVDLPEREPELAIVRPNEHQPVPAGAPVRLWGALTGGIGGEAEAPEQDEFVWWLGKREVARGGRLDPAAQAGPS